MGGLQPSDLIILAGRPSMGKTALATNIAFNVARARARSLAERPDLRPDDPGHDGAVVGFFSLEMSAEQLATRILSEQAGIPSEKIRRGMIDEDEFKQPGRGQPGDGQPARSSSTRPAASPSPSSRRARAAQAPAGPGPARRRLPAAADRRVQARATTACRRCREITTGLKALAKELNVPIIALSQLSRAVENREDKRPQLADLRESGSIEQDADIVMFVFREEYYR